MLEISVVVEASDNSYSYFEDLLYNLFEQSIEKKSFEIILVCHAGSSDQKKMVVDKWHRLYPNSVRLIEYVHDEYSDSRNEAIYHATKEWITFFDLRQRLPPDYFKSIDAFIQQHSSDSLVLISTDISPNKKLLLLPVDQLINIPMQASSCLFKKDILLKSGAMFDTRIRPDFIDAALISRYLLEFEKGDLKIGYVPLNWLEHNTIPDTSASLTSSWSMAHTYNEAIELGYIDLLKHALQSKGMVPGWLQKAVLYDLHWYFKTDMGERAPTSWVSEGMAVHFHSLVKQVVSYTHQESLRNLDLGPSEVEVLHALLSYMGSEYYSYVSLKSYDHDQDMVCISYYVHGKIPVENILLDGIKVEPAHSKYRSCNFFRRTLFHQRIAWLPVGDAKTIEVLMDGKPALLGIGLDVFLSVDDLETKVSLSSVRYALPPGRAGRKTIPLSLAGLKVRLLRWLAMNILVRSYFKDAWVFADRKNEADDNAEHLYRWLRKNHPEIKAWFLLDRFSSDWDRLSKEGFRLMSCSWTRKLLLLNSKHIISSQTTLVNGGFDIEKYGDLMRWRFTFLQHGVTEKDISHWLNNSPFDRISTTTPDEYLSIVGDGTPYDFTTKETQRTGLCRHDKLGAMSLQISLQEVDIILVMPTWRGKLGEKVSRELTVRDKITRFANSEYAQHWGSLLRNLNFQRLAEAHGKKIVFMPHPDSVPYISAFDPPEHVEIKTKSTNSIQNIFCRSAVMITDYSSVAFEMAYLHRPVIYYQFDRERFFGEDHNWREGYFKYDRDGFGPVAKKEREVISFLEAILSNNAQPDQIYLERMNNTFPERDGQACKRVYESIVEIHNTKPSP